MKRIAMSVSLVLSVCIVLIPLSNSCLAEDSGNHFGFEKVYESLKSPKHHWSSNLRTFAWSPDGEMLVIGHSDNLSKNYTLKLITMTDWQVRKITTNHSKSITVVSWSPDGNLLASGSVDKSVIIWNISQWTPMVSLDVGDIVDDISWSITQEYLAIGTHKQPLTLWNTTDWTFEISLANQLIETKNSDFLANVEYSPDGKHILSQPDNGEIDVWETEEWKRRATLKAHAARIYSLSWSPIGDMFLSSSGDGTVKVWSLDDLNCISRIRSWFGSFHCAAWSPDGETLLVGDTYGDLRLYDCKTWRVLERHFLDSWIQWLGWSPDGNTVSVYFEDGDLILLSMDSNGDGISDKYHSNKTYEWYCTDKDGDNKTDMIDAFPEDAAASLDLDFDGYPDAWNHGKGQEDSTENLVLDTNLFDHDNDGYNDANDALPRDPSEWSDMDGDSIGDNSDFFPTDPAAARDEDGDGYPDIWNFDKDEVDSTTGLELDIFPDNPREWKDSDQDGKGDNADMIFFMHDGMFILLVYDAVCIAVVIVVYRLRRGK